MKRASRTVVLSSILLGSLLASLGCSGSIASGDGSSSAAASVPGTSKLLPEGTTVAAVAPSVRSSRVRMIADALANVPLRDDQRAEIETLATDADARHAAAAGARGAIMTALATQIEGGKIDRAALQAQIDAATDAANATRPADQAALQRLHTLLTPEQRGQVADAIAARHDAMHREHGDHAHASHQARMEEWATDLKLTDAQRAQIGAVLAAQHGAHHADFKPMHDKMAPGGHPFADAFRADTLVLPSPPDDAHAHANAMADHVVGLAQAVLPLLTPEQRGLAAAKLRAHVAGNAGNEEGPLGE